MVSGQQLQSASTRTFSKMQWDRSNTIGMAIETCKYCEGNGTRVVYKTKASPCNCVFRAIFRACLTRFRDCAFNGAPFGTVSWDFSSGPGGRRIYSRKQEEYMADFCLVSRRVLDEADHRVFRYYFLLGADWQLCARQLKMDRGNFFHTIYRIERTLGRAFSEIRPYALYPLDEYFGGTIRKSAGRALEPAPAHRNRLQVPLRFVA
jgi:hypothetical protein